MIRKYVDQASQYYRDPENPTWDDRGGELSDIIEEVCSYSEYTRKSFDFEGYVNSNIYY